MTPGCWTGGLGSDLQRGSTAPAAGHGGKPEPVGNGGARLCEQLAPRHSRAPARSSQSPPDEVGKGPQPLGQDSDIAGTVPSLSVPDKALRRGSFRFAVTSPPPHCSPRAPPFALALGWGSEPGDKACEAGDGGAALCRAQQQVFCILLGRGWVGPASSNTPERGVLNLKSVLKASEKHCITKSSVKKSFDQL